MGADPVLKSNGMSKATQCLFAVPSMALLVLTMLWSLGRRHGFTFGSLLGIIAVSLFNKDFYSLVFPRVLEQCLWQGEGAE